MNIVTQILILDPPSTNEIARFGNPFTWSGKAGPWRDVPFDPHPSDNDSLRTYAILLDSLGYTVTITEEIEREEAGGEGIVY